MIRNENEVLRNYLAIVLQKDRSDFKLGRGAELSNCPSDGFRGFVVYDTKQDIKYSGTMTHEGIIGIEYFIVGFERGCLEQKLKKKKTSIYYHCNTPQVKQLNAKLLGIDVSLI